MEYQIINKFISKIIETVDFDKREIKGCTLAEILDLENNHPAKKDLPKALKEFLTFGGRKITYWKPGTGFFYPFFYDVNYKLDKTFLDSNYCANFFGNQFLDKFPSDAFLFYSNQGYEYMFIRLSEGDDPPVYFFDNDESMQHFSIVSESFSQWLNNSITMFIEYHNVRMNNVKIERKKFNDFKSQLLSIIDLIKDVNSFHNFERLSIVERSYERVLSIVYSLCEKEPTLLKSAYLNLLNNTIIDKTSLSMQLKEVLNFEVNKTINLFLDFINQNHIK